MALALGILLVLAGGALAAVSLYLLVLALASFGYRQSLDGFAPRARLLVLVPAHDEELSIGRTVHSLLAQTYPAGLYRVAVIADNCTDATVQQARQAGAHEVLVRHAPDARGKGRALRWALDSVLADPGAPDAIVSVDADTTAEPDLLMALAERMAQGSEAVQADYCVYGDGIGSALRQMAFLLMNRVRPAGRNVLGMSSIFGGNGWLLRSDVLRRVPWEAFSGTEDREYGLALDRAGVHVAFAGAAAVRAPTAPSAAAAATQSERWEGGWLSLVRAQLPRLVTDAVRSRRPSLLLAAFDLAVPPMGLLAVAALGGTLAAAVLTLAGAPWWGLVPWLVALLAIPLYVLVGLRAGDAPPAIYRALLHAPLFVLRKPLSLGRTLRARGDVWVRTERVRDVADG